MIQAVSLLGRKFLILSGRDYLVLYFLNIVAFGSDLRDYRALLEKLVIFFFFSWFICEFELPFTYYYSDGQLDVCKWISDNPVHGCWTIVLSHDTRAHQFHPPIFFHPPFPSTCHLPLSISSLIFDKPSFLLIPFSRWHRLAPPIPHGKQQNKNFRASPTRGLDLSWLRVDDHREPPEQATIDDATIQPSKWVLAVKDW